MYKYHCLNPIADIGLSQFRDEYAAVSHMDDADAVLVRSAAMHDLEFGDNLKVIARAGAGVNNIPLNQCAEEGIVVFKDGSYITDKIYYSARNNESYTIIRHNKKLNNFATHSKSSEISLFILFISNTILGSSPSTLLPFPIMF